MRLDRKPGGEEPRLHPGLPREPFKICRLRAPRCWVFKIFQEIHGVMTGLANKDEPPDDVTGTPSVADLED